MVLWIHVLLSSTRRMANLRILIVVLLVSLQQSTAQPPSTRAQEAHRALRGHKVYRLSGDSVPDRLRPLVATVTGLDVLQYSGGSTPEATVRVLPGAEGHFQELLDDGNIQHELVIRDLAEYLQEHDNHEHRAASARVVEENECTGVLCETPLRKTYMTFEQMEWYLHGLNASLHPRVELTSMGTSVEGRHLWLVKLTPNPSNDGSKRSGPRDAVWVEGGIHAREWISPMTSLHLLHKLATDCSSNCDVDYYFAPIVNPDGYEYSRTVDRMWRKNRAVNQDSSCVGVDLNRNWDFKFGVGASSDPCSDTFKGSEPFSEPETKAVSQRMSEVDNLKVVLAIHSYGQKMYYPWGWTTSPTADHEDLARAGNAFAEAVDKAGGKSYQVENSAGGLYFASGATDDWSKKILNVPYTYTLELRDAGAGGFVLSADEIKPTADEVIAGVSALIDEVRRPSPAEVE